MDKTLLSLRDTPDQLAQLTMFGDPQVLRFAAQNMGLESAWRTLADSIHIEAVSNLSHRKLNQKAQQKSGISQISYLHAAIAAAQRGDISDCVPDRFTKHPPKPQVCVPQPHRTAGPRWEIPRGVW